jgi:DNA-binding beta-propeller fold protein YncE
MALAPNGNTLYVADAGNHAVRTVDLVSGVVETVAGTGRQAHGPIADAGHARATDLNSPWDLLPAPGDAAVLFIAMAGSHQIARLDLRAETIAAFAGTGREGRADGPARAAAFAQPSGLATDGRGRLFVADAESSCVRCIDGPDGGAPTVRTLAGGDLFAFGDVDGVGDDARLQHPLGVAWHDGTVFIADTYNHKIRRLDPGSGRVTGWAGSASELCEPGGLSAGGDVLYVADTNCHRVRAINIASGRIAEVPLPGLCAPDLCFAERGDGAS